MLKKLTIKNYILIDSLTIEFDNGLSVITGETGAGKSILVGAINLLTGAKADTSVITNGATKSIIEGVFDIEHYPVSEIFEANELDYEKECVIRREININGKSRAFINDTPVSLSLLKELTQNIIEIHSQHQNLLLADSTFQIDAIDLYAGNQALLQEYRTQYTTLNKTKAQLKELQEQYQKNASEEDYLKYISAQFKEASLKDNEDQELEAERNLLSNSEEIKGALYTATGLFDEEQGVITKLSSILSQVRNANKQIPIDEITSRIESLYIEAKDIASETATLAENITYDPQRLMQVEERLSQIYTLQKRYSKNSVEELLQYSKQVEEKLSTLQSGDDTIIQLQKDITEQSRILQQTADKLTNSRHEAGKKFSQILEDMARPLSMPNLQFKVQWQTNQHLAENGAEQAIYTFTANKNMPLVPLSKSASGGEISRLMLCVKSIMAQSGTMPVMLFDEIDSGISGETAGKVGSIMQQMSQKQQIIVITHLPQVASKGEYHYTVTKNEEIEQPTATIKQLTPSERVTEIARMMSSDTTTQAAITLATQLLNNK